VLHELDDLPVPVGQLADALGPGDFRRAISSVHWLGSVKKPSSLTDAVRSA
jgi:hypothetical protein